MLDLGIRINLKIKKRKTRGLFMNKIMKLVLSLLITVTLIPTMTISADGFTVESVGDNTYI